MDEFVHTNQAVAAELRRNFLIMKVNYSQENANEEFLSAYPKVPAYPHFFVLNSQGQFLHSQGTAELEEGRSYNEEVFLEFLHHWRPQSQPASSDQGAANDPETFDDAEEALSAGLERARKEAKRVLVHFSAPS